MVPFKVGDKCVCVDDSVSPTSIGGMYPQVWVNWPKEGVIYTIREIFAGKEGPAFLLEEIRNPLANFKDGRLEPGFAADRFRPLVSDSALEQFRALVPRKQPVEA